MENIKVMLELMRRNRGTLMMIGPAMFNLSALALFSRKEDETDDEYEERVKKNREAIERSRNDLLAELCTK